MIVHCFNLIPWSAGGTGTLQTIITFLIRLPGGGGLLATRLGRTRLGRTLRHHCGALEQTVSVLCDALRPYREWGEVVGELWYSWLTASSLTPDYSCLIISSERSVVIQNLEEFQLFDAVQLYASWCDPRMSQTTLWCGVLPRHLLSVGILPVMTVLGWPPRFLVWIILSIVSYWQNIKNVSCTTRFGSVGCNVFEYRRRCQHADCCLSLFAWDSKS